MTKLKTLLWVFVKNALCLWHINEVDRLISSMRSLLCLLSQRKHNPVISLILPTNLSGKLVALATYGGLGVDVVSLRIPKWVCGGGQIWTVGPCLVHICCYVARAPPSLREKANWSRPTQAERESCLFSLVKSFLSNWGQTQWWEFLQGLSCTAGAW